MLALLLHSHAKGLFSSRGIKRATYRQVAVRYLCANPHPDQDTIFTSPAKLAELTERPDIGCMIDALGERPGVCLHQFSNGRTHFAAVGVGASVSRTAVPLTRESEGFTMT